MKAKITFGSNIEKIQSNAFKGIKNLKKINVRNDKLTKNNVEKKAFKGIKENVVIKVPSKMKKKYAKLFVKKGLSGKVTVK